MADCNCGCGLKVRLGRRGMNKNIRRTDDLLATLKQAQQDALGFKPSPDSNPEGIKEMVDDLLLKGEDYRRFWIEATHGDHPQVVSEALEIKHGWNQWTRSVLSVSVILVASPEEQRRFVEYARRH
ncbi:MAG: hypothetical protein ACYC91_17310 [Solirubrobacteraceae bacterium]